MKHNLRVCFLITIMLFLRLAECVWAKAPAEDLVFSVWGRQTPKFYVSADWQNLEKKPKHSAVFLDRQKDAYFVFSHSYLNPVPLNYVPARDEINKDLKIVACAGEYEPVSFGIFAKDDLKNVVVTVDSPKGSDNRKIAADNIEVRVLKHVPQKAGKKRYRLEPLILERMENISVSHRTTKQFWLTVYVPQNTPPGIYRGRIKIEGENYDPKFIGLEINVLSIELKTPDINYGIYYNIDNRWQGFYPKNLKKHLIDIKEHGLKSISVYIGPAVVKKDEKFQISLTDKTFYSPWSLDEFMEIYKSLGFKDAVPYLGVWYPLIGEIERSAGYKKMTETFDEMYEQALYKVEAERLFQEWPEFLYSPEDEPMNLPEKMELCRYYIKMIKDTLPQVRTYLSLNGWWKGIDEADLLDEWLDVRCYAPTSLELKAHAKRSKDEFWVYNGGSEGKNPLLDRFFYGFYAIKIGARGVFQWVYQWPVSLEKNPYQELELGAQGWYYTYPTEQGPVPTPAWEAIREGIDDAKYFFTLKDMLDKAKQKGIILKRAAEKIETELDEKILEKINLLNISPQKVAISTLNYNYQILDQWRLFLIEKIIELRKIELGIK